MPFGSADGCTARLPSAIILAGSHIISSMSTQLAVLSPSSHPREEGGAMMMVMPKQATNLSRHYFAHSSPLESRPTNREELLLLVMLLSHSIMMAAQRTLRHLLLLLDGVVINNQEEEEKEKEELAKIPRSP